MLPILIHEFLFVKQLPLTVTMCYKTQRNIITKYFYSDPPIYIDYPCKNVLTTGLNIFQYSIKSIKNVKVTYQS